MTEISGIIPAVNDFKQFRKFLESEYGTCVIMHCTIFDLETMFKELKSHGKQALIHCDLIKGLSADEYGAEYLCGKLHPAGLISIKPSVISACRKLSVTAVQRAFLIDSSALEKSILSIEKIKPDYVELLPALCTPLFPILKERLKLPLIAGGLIQSKAMAEEILKTGVEAVTISMSTLLKG
jgi:glycerol uptake operon antiterminator